MRMLNGFLTEDRDRREMHHSQTAVVLLVLHCTGATKQAGSSELQLIGEGTELGTSPMAEYCDTGGSAPVDNPGYTRVLPEETATLRLFAYGTSRIACGDVTFAGSVAGS